jgi:mRNA-degrading endonuclease RelE of RelBE toxin-antitoxin system
MKYSLKPTRFFLEQVENLSEKGKKILKDKLRLVKENPSRNKRIVGPGDLFLFRIRFTDQNTEMRAIYLLDSPEIILICLLDRGNEYKDLKKYLKKLGYL